MEPRINSTPKPFGQISPRSFANVNGQNYNTTQVSTTNYLDGATIRKSVQIMHSNTPEAKLRLSKALNELPPKNQDKFMNLVDYLTSVFAFDNPPYGCNIMYNGLKRHLIKIFEQHPDFAVSDDDVNLVLRMCTAQNATWKFVTYTGTLTEVIDAAKIKRGWTPRSLPELQAIGNLYDNMERELKAKDVMNKVEYDKKLTDLFQLMCDKEINEAFKKIQNYKIKGIIDDNTQKALIKLTGIVYTMECSDITTASSCLKEIIEHNNDNKVNKQLMLFVRDHFSLLYLKTASSVKNYQLTTLTLPDTCILRENDLKNTDLSNWKISRIELNRINSLEGCIINDNTVIDISEPELIGQRCNYLAQLNDWISYCENAINTSNDDSLKNKISQSFRLKIQDALYKILIRSNAEESLIQKCRVIANKHQLNFDDILSLANIEPRFQLTLELKKYEEMENTLKKLINSGDSTAASECIAEIIVFKTKHNTEIRNFIEYCAGNYRDNGKGANCPVEYFNAISRNDIYDKFRYGYPKQIHFRDFSQANLDFKNKNISDFLLKDLKLEDCKSFAGCVADNTTMIFLKTPSFSSDIDVENWLNRCIEVIKTANNEHLISSLKTAVVRVLTSTCLSPEKLEQFKTDFNTRFLPSQQYIERIKNEFDIEIYPL